MLEQACTMLEQGREGHDFSRAVKSREYARFSARGQLFRLMIIFFWICVLNSLLKN